MKKKRTIIIALLIVFCVNTFGQTKYQKGIYLSFEEIIQNKPSANYNVEIEKRTEGEIKMNGGNDYQLNALDKSTNRSDLKKVVDAYSDGENLYLNCKKLKLQSWYCKVLSDKKYFVFSGALPNVLKDFDMEISELPTMFGAIGGALNGMKLALLRFPFILEKSTQKITLVSSKNINTVFANDKELLEKYNQDMEKNKMETILKFLVEWNEKQ
jgi:hypothetical protein